MRYFIYLTLFAQLCFAQNFEEFSKAQKDAMRLEAKNYEIYNKNIQNEFKEYQLAQQKAFDRFKKGASIYWEEAKMPTATSLINYTFDKKTRGEIDFKNEKIVIESIAKNDEEAIKNLQDELEKLVSISTKEFDAIDPLEQELSKIKPPKGTVLAPSQDEQIVSNVIFGKKPSKDELKIYREKNINAQTIKTLKSTKVAGESVYSVTIELPSDTKIKKSKEYESEVSKQSQARKISKSLIFAIIDSESSFNPKARSHTPAFGLMQIVPTSAGRDAHKFLYGTDRVVSETYLYNSTNNITMGSAYFHILYYRYLSGIKDELSRLYCAIAAYNTGAGNVARAFVKTTNISKATVVINSMSPQDVYAHLLANLPYQETRSYLKVVHTKIGSYSLIYKD
ncbi:MAG: transglycosylase SLT domain-containing protein [Sulfurimonas sp.]|jgi:membrane-bound lytic murein transglycosylase C|nr:transglycosylase SLT domain-containing protein [Sulfurimonadaceae bacterium]